jgi:hypothetical protein
LDGHFEQNQFIHPGFYKPLVIFAQCLKIFGNFGIEKVGNSLSPSGIFPVAYESGFISFFALQLLTTMLKTSCQLRARCHKDIDT